MHSPPEGGNTDPGGQLVRWLLEQVELRTEAAMERALARHRPAAPTSEPATMTIEAAMRELGVSDRTIRRWISIGKLRARRSEASGSGRVLVSVESIRELQGVAK